MSALQPKSFDKHFDASRVSSMVVAQGNNLGQQQLLLTVGQPTRRPNDPATPNSWNFRLRPQLLHEFWDKVVSDLKANGDATILLSTPLDERQFHELYNGNSGRRCAADRGPTLCCSTSTIF